MYYEGLLLFRTPMLTTNKIYVVDDSDNFISDNHDVITQNINILTRDIISLELEFVNPQQTVSDNDLRIILEKQYRANPQEISALIEKSKANYTYNFWQILRNNNIDFRGPDLDIYNAFAIISFSENEYQFYRFALHTLDDAKDLSRLIFNEYDYVIRPESYGFMGFSGFPQEKKIITTPSPNVGKEFTDKDKPRIDKMNEVISSIVDTIQGMDRDEGITWLSRLIGENMIETLNLPAPKLSGLAINDDLKLLLTDLNNEEVKIDPLTKAFYYMFLIYDKGVSFSYLNKYQEPVFEVYKMLSNRTNLDKLKASVRNLMDPYSELLPQKISRLRRQLLVHFPRGVVDKYYLPYYRGDGPNDFRTIDLDRSKITVTSQLDFVREMETQILGVIEEENKKRYSKPYDYDEDNEFSELPEIETDTEEEPQPEEGRHYEEEEDDLSNLTEEELKLWESLETVQEDEIDYESQDDDNDESKPNEVHFDDNGQKGKYIYMLD